jgi:sodium-dependent dicarboxylate transporter 2/3/5
MNSQSTSDFESSEESLAPATRRILLWAAPLLGVLVFLLIDAAMPIRQVAGLTVWMAIWWLTSAVPAPVTALLPLLLLPSLGVLDSKAVAQSYGHELILLLAGGFMLSQALEHTGAHRRLAMWMLKLTGASSGRALLAGFILATGVLSMWISNTATALMMMPVALAILEHYPDRRLSAPLILAIAYAASLGGMGSPIGTPPNLVFMGVYEQTTGTRIGFMQWLSFGIPLLLLTLPLLWLWLGRGLRNAPAATLPELGPISRAETRVLWVFLIIACAWIFRSEPFGGYSALLALPGINDASIALAGVVAMCLIPDGRGGTLLSWQRAERIPWGALLVFAGGICLAEGFARSGLSDLVAQQLTGLSALPVWLLLLLICLSVTILSEIASNTATAVLLMPILAATATANGLDPALLMLPAALAASLGFMLPVATAPNAVAFGTGLISSRRMLREGWVVDLMGVLVLATVSYMVFAPSA